MKLVLAPIQGMTVAYYRNEYDRIFGGIDIYYSPFITTSDPSKFSSRLLKDIVPENNSKNLTLVPQLLGNNGNDFNYYAQAITDLGYKEINWNIGCPYPMVTTKKKGSGILPHPDMIRNFLDIVCKDSTYNLSVKMRLGLHDSEESIAIMEVLNDYPLKGITIHARTGKQMYTGQVDLDGFETLISLCNHEITYNGDIFTYDDFIAISGRFPNIHRYMLGRGVLSDPFLPVQIKGLSMPVSKLEHIKTFHDSIYNNYCSILSGDKHVLDKMKEFWFYMIYNPSLNMPNNIDYQEKLLKKIKKSSNSSTYLNVVNSIFSGLS